MRDPFVSWFESDHEQAAVALKRLRANPSPAGVDEFLDAELGALPDLVSGVTRIFTAVAERSLQRGVLRGHRTLDADLHTIRGRIHLAEQLRRRPGLDLPLAVRYQEHDEDILEINSSLRRPQCYGGLACGT